MLSSMLEEEAISHCCNFSEESSSESEGQSGSDDSSAEDAPGKASTTGCCCFPIWLHFGAQNCSTARQSGNTCELW